MIAAIEVFLISCTAKPTVGGIEMRVPVDRDHPFRWKMIMQSGGT
jgi:hypothetical protein